MTEEPNGPDDPDPPGDPAASDEQEPSDRPETESDPAESGPAEPAIKVRGLSKELKLERWFLKIRRGRAPIRAVNGMSFTIAPGEAVGYLGTDGAHKTTMVEILTGELAPTAGTVRTCGLEPVTEHEELQRRVGVMFGHRPKLWPDLSLAESLRILASIHGLSERRWIPRRTELIERLHLAAFIEHPVQQLSPGRRRRAEIAAALLHEPELVVLDEPTRGLDIASKEQLRAFLRQEHQIHGRTLLITSSDLGEVEQFCDRLLVVDQGQLAYDGDVPGLIAQAGAQRILVIDLTAADRLLDDVPGTSLLAVEEDGLRQRLSFSPDSVSTSRVLADVAARAGIRNLALQDPRLEDVVRRLSVQQQGPSES